MGAVQQKPVAALSVNSASPDHPQQFWIEGTVPGETWDDRNVQFSGFFGAAGPHVFAAAPDMRDCLDDALRVLTALNASHLIDLAYLGEVLAKAEGRTDA